MNLLNDTDSFDKDLLNYETTLKNIVILKNYKYKNLDGDLRIVFERDQLSRETLNFHKHYNSQIVEELNSYFEERLDKKIKYMKSKQKI